MIGPGLRASAAPAAFFLWCLAACTRPAPALLPVGKPVFAFDYEAVRELLVVRNEPSNAPWSARFVQDGWLGPQQVTPRWLVRQAPEGTTPSDPLADGGFLRHLLDSLKGLRKVAEAPQGEDATFGLQPAWTRLEWSQGERRFELLLGAPAGTTENSGGRYARIGSERLIVNGATLDMLSMMTSFQRTRHQRLFTWTLDDADRVRIRWNGPSSGTWSAERSSGDWAPTGAARAGRSFSKSPAPALEALAHLQIESFEIPKETFGSPNILVEWLDRRDHRLLVEVDSGLRARTSDRPGAVFQLHAGAREVLAKERFPR